MSESEMSDFLESTWKNVLQVAANEFFRRDFHRTVLVGTRSFDEEDDLALTIIAWRHTHDPMIADRNAKDVR